MRLNAIIILAAIFLVACSNSSSNSKPSDGNVVESQNKIRINSIPETALGASLSLKEIPEGVYLFQSLRFTAAYKDSDNSFQHIVQELGFVKEGDTILTQNSIGSKNFGIRTAFPYEIHSTLNELALIDIRNYSAFIQEDGAWEWSLDESGKGLYCDELSNVFEQSKMTSEKLYESMPTCNFSNYKIVFQSNNENLYITVQETNRDLSPGEVRYQLIYKKGASVSSTPISKVLKK